jgi:hypothetical protein
MNLRFDAYESRLQELSRKYMLRWDRYRFHKKRARTRYTELMFCIWWDSEDITSPDTTLFVTFDSEVKQFFIMSIFNTFDELILHHDVRLISFTKVLTLIKVSHMGYAAP